MQFLAKNTARRRHTFDMTLVPKYHCNTSPQPSNRNTGWYTIHSNTDSRHTSPLPPDTDSPPCLTWHTKLDPPWFRCSTSPPSECYSRLPLDIIRRRWHRSVLALEFRPRCRSTLCTGVWSADGIVVVVVEHRIVWSWCTVTAPHLANEHRFQQHLPLSPPTLPSALKPFSFQSNCSSSKFIAACFYLPQFEGGTA